MRKGGQEKREAGNKLGYGVEVKENETAKGGTFSCLLLHGFVRHTQYHFDGLTFCIIFRVSPETETWTNQ